MGKTISLAFCQNEKIDSHKINIPTLRSYIILRQLSMLFQLALDNIIQKKKKCLDQPYESRIVEFTHLGTNYIIPFKTLSSASQKLHEHRTMWTRVKWNINEYQPFCVVADDSNNMAWKSFVCAMEMGRSYYRTEHSFLRKQKHVHNWPGDGASIL